MATPNASHFNKPVATPRPPMSGSVMTPPSFSASSPAAPPSHGGHRSHASPAPFSSGSPSASLKAAKSPFSHLQQPQLQNAHAGGQPMSRAGTNTSSPGSLANLGQGFAALNGILMNGVEGGNFKTGLTPAGGIGTPSGISPLPEHLPGADGTASSMNGSMRQQVRDQEEERRLRLERIVSMSAERWGYVSREGVERCAKRVGLECLWEDEIPGAESRTLSIAGSSVLVDITFLKEGDEISNVTLTFPGREHSEWGKCGEAGAAVLRTDLKGEENEQAFYVELEPFMHNLERLARLDLLGVAEVNCFDAVDGLGGALREIWKLEIKKREEEEGKQDTSDDLAEQHVMCKESGQAAMHAGSRLGLSIQYWTERRCLAGRKRKADEMEIDDSSSRTTGLEGKPRVWSATIECESSSADLYPPIRISNNWVSEQKDQSTTNQQDPFASNNDNSESSLSTWQDPPPNFITVDPSALDAMNIDTDTLLPQTSKPPDVRFVARLNPPVLVPLQTALDIYNSVGAPLPQESIQATTYASLIIPNQDGSPSDPTAERNAEREMYVPVKDADEHVTKKHKYTLFADPAQSYARLVENIPFSHPRRLIAILPVLRQWALVSSLLRRCLGSRTTPQETTDGHVAADSDSSSDDDDDDDDDFDPFHPFKTNNNSSHRVSDLKSKSAEATAIDISLTLSPSGASPLITLVFPFKNDVADLSFRVDLNGEIGGVEINLGNVEQQDPQATGGEEGEEKVGQRKEKVRRVLEVCEDLGAVVEWMGGAGVA
ncbi:MAG: hypothetical protein Q9220_007257 [cf. Caloplaca sp. 1 TL-2023]